MLKGSSSSSVDKSTPATVPNKSKREPGSSVGPLEGGVEDETEGEEVASSVGNWEILGTILGIEDGWLVGEKVFVGERLGGREDITVGLVEEVGGEVGRRDGIVEDNTVGRVEDRSVG